MTSLVPTGTIELTFSDNEVSKGIFIENSDIKKYLKHMKELEVFVSDKLDQNMVNYSNFVAFVDLISVLETRKNNTYLTVCDCSK